MHDGLTPLNTAAMLRKKSAYTVVTPIPSFVPRRLAIELLHSHSEVITLNPLVLSHRPIPPPSSAATDEFFSTWYSIVERIQYVPGLGRAGAGTISFCGCFHNLPWGLQTHVYAPLGIDLRHRYRVAGNQPGERPDEERELGLAELGVPSDGLYLREDIEIKCNIAIMSFVKAQLRAASRSMLDRFVRKAELLDSGVLRAMMENGRLKTINPNDRSRPVPSEQQLLPSQQQQPSPNEQDRQLHQPMPSSSSPSPMQSPDLLASYPGHTQAQPQQQHLSQNYQLQHYKLPDDYTTSPPPVAVELPADPEQHRDEMDHSPSPPAYLVRPTSSIAAHPRWSQSPNLAAARRVSAPGLASPSFAAELPAHDDLRMAAPRSQVNTSFRYH